MESYCESIQKLWSSNNTITIQANLRIVNFLEVQLNLDISTYQPYRKRDNIPVYFQKNFNNPTTILKQWPTSIQKRISDISLIRYIRYIRYTIPIHQDALKKSGSTEQLKYIASDNNKEKYRKDETPQKDNYLVQSTIFSECKNKYR